MDSTTTVGAAIRNAREGAGIPLRKLAGTLDIDQSTLSKIERGERRPSIQMLEIVATALDISLEELLVCHYSDIVESELMPAYQFYEQVLQTVRERMKRCKTLTVK